MSTFDAEPSAIRDTVTRALAEDLGADGDITAALIPPGARLAGSLVARADGVLAGTACVTETYAQLDRSVALTWTGQDGASLRTGVVIARVEGPARAVLTGERTALNFLCHLSGVATMTRRFVDAARSQGADVAPGSEIGPEIWDTRKTLPGLRALEKAAVRAGGGVNHRSSLSDLVLVKDNHLALLDPEGAGLVAVVDEARRRWPGREVEIECDGLPQVRDAVAAVADRVMLDNMTPDEAAAAVAVVRAGPRPTTPVEISGGVTLDNVAEYARAGADLISTSAVTQSAPALDIGLDLILPELDRAPGPGVT